MEARGSVKEAELYIWWAAAQLVVDQTAPLQFVDWCLDCSLKLRNKIVFRVIMIVTLVINVDNFIAWIFDLNM